MKRNRPARGQEGLASIVVVSILIVILTLISLGFARLISRSISNSANRQISATATYAAESGINDVAAYLKKYIQDPVNAGSGFLPKSDNCTGPGSFLNNPPPPGVQGPFVVDSKLSADTHYTCILLNPTPSQLSYKQVSNLKSQVVKVNTSAAVGALQKLMISWQASDPQINGYPTNPTGFYDETTWNKANSQCQFSGNNAPCIPILRATIIPVSNGQSLNSVKSKTVYLYPKTPAGNIKDVSFGDDANLPDGGIIPVPCNDQAQPGSFAPSKSDYKCNIIIDSLVGVLGAGNNTDSVYLRLTPIYNQADIKIRANDRFGDTLNFINDQAVIDVTAQTSNVAKRLQAWVDISSLASNTDGVGPNVSSRSDGIPEQTIRSANALCKREILDNPGNGFSTYVAFQDPDDVCHNSTVGANPVPKLTFKINGQDWNRAASSYSVQTRDSEEETPSGSGHLGTLYLPAGGSANLTWTTQDASSCKATVGSGSDGWAGDKTPLMTFSGSPSINGSGSQTINGINNVTEYDLQCDRIYSPGPSPIKKVYAWPPPTVNVSWPASVVDGQDYSIPWSANNASSCNLTGNWQTPGVVNNASGALLNQTQTMHANDTDTSTLNFSITCTDPAGRSASDSKAYPKCNGDCHTDSNPPPPTIERQPPDCKATTSANDNGDAAVNYSWSGSCVLDNPADASYQVFSSTDGWLSSNAASGSGTTPGLRTSQFCLTLVISVTNWGERDRSTSCATPRQPGQDGAEPCTANLTGKDNGDGTGSFSWNGSCPPANPRRGNYQFYNCVNYDCNSIGIYGDGSVGEAGPDIKVGQGHFCLDYRSGAAPWGWLADSGQVCIDVVAPLTVVSFNAAIWNQIPECGSATGIFNDTWFCRNSPTDVVGRGTTVTTINNDAPPCADGTHRWTSCTGKITWQTSGGVGTVNCTASAANGYGSFDSTSWAGGSSINSHSSGRQGWIGKGDPRPLTLSCTDSNGNIAGKSIFPGLF